MIAPRPTTIGVQATVTAYPGYTQADVEASAEQTLADWLSSWGTTDTGEWVAEDTTVRISEVIDYLNRAAGVHWVDMASVRLQA